MLKIKIVDVDQIKILLGGVNFAARYDQLDKFSFNSEIIDSISCWSVHKNIEMCDHF